MEESHELVGYRLEPAGPDTDTLAAYLTLNDPERRNALSDALLDQLSELLQRAASDPRVRVIVLTSSHPRVFSSGGNLDAFADDRRDDRQVRGPLAISCLVPHAHGHRQAGRLRC